MPVTPDGGGGNLGQFGPHYQDALALTTALKMFPENSGQAEAAVKAYQQLIGQPADGYYDAALRAELISEGITNPPVAWNFNRATLTGVQG